MGERVGSGTDSEQEEQEEEEEKRETSDESEACEWNAASDDEEENSLASCSQQETPGRKRKITESDSDDDHTLSWIPDTLVTINAADARMIDRSVWITHPYPKSFLPDLEQVRNAAMLLVNNTDAAISLVKAQQSLLDRKAWEGELHALRQELAESVERSQAEYRKQAAALQQAKGAVIRQNMLFQKEKESLTCAHKLERETLIDQQRHLKRQLEEERDKSICCVCQDKPRDTIILPCLHFQYCFSCLLRHRDTNSNTCPTCRGPIQGLSMSSYLATQ